MTIARCDVPQDNCWNVEALYRDMAAWQSDYEAFKAAAQNNSWPDLQSFRGRLADAEQLRHLLDQYCATLRTLEKLYTYVHLRHDEDTVNEEHKAAYQRIVNDHFDFRKASAWIEPELLELPQERCQQLLDDPRLAQYRFHLEKILRLRPHTLSPDKEELLAMSGKALLSSQKAFRAMNDADFNFGKVADSEGRQHDLTHGSYFLFLRGRDRELRRQAFEGLHRRFREYQNTISELLQGNCQSHLFNARARHYDTCLEAALYPNNIDVSLYHNLIKTVHDNLDALHSYTALRKELLGLDSLHAYDLYVPLVEEVEIAIDFDEAAGHILDSAQTLGAEYRDLLALGLQGPQRWVDRYENKNKRSGAYSSGCYDSYPYILMNYKGVLRDAFTLAHEAGHSMHSLLCHRHQPFHYASYPIFLAEVASTFNEQLLMDVLLQRYREPRQQAFLLNEQIEEIRATLFRQVLFAEFELFIHRCAEENRPLTPQLLNDTYAALVRQYYGPALQVDDLLASEWARIPHFYYNFYVYQYATGLSAALALHRRVSDGGARERQQYLQFLKDGCSKHPLDILEGAGVDMRSGAPVAAAIATFRRHVAQLAQLLGSGQVST